MLFPGRIDIARSPWHLGDFCNIFLPNISEDQKSLTVRARGPGTVPYGKYDAGYCITSVAPGNKSGRGASSNMTDFRFCEVQNRRRKCCSLVRKMMWSISKWRYSPKFWRFFRSKLGDLQKKKKKVFRFHMLISQCHFDGPLSSSWALCWAAEANGLPEAHGPRGHCPPCPLLGGPALRS